MTDGSGQGSGGHSGETAEPRGVTRLGGTWRPGVALGRLRPRSGHAESGSGGGWACRLPPAPRPEVTEARNWSQDGGASPLSHWGRGPGPRAKDPPSSSSSEAPGTRTAGQGPRDAQLSPPLPALVIGKLVRKWGWCGEFSLQHLPCVQLAPTHPIHCVPPSSSKSGWALSTKLGVPLQHSQV